MAGQSMTSSFLPDQPAALALMGATRLLNPASWLIKSWRPVKIPAQAESAPRIASGIFQNRYAVLLVNLMNAARIKAGTITRAASEIHVRQWTASGYGPPFSAKPSPRHRRATRRRASCSA